MQDGKKAWASSVQLTDAGQLLLRYAERLLALSTDAITATRDVQEVRTGSIYLAASQTTGVYLLPRLIGDKAIAILLTLKGAPPKPSPCSWYCLAVVTRALAAVVHASGLAHVSHL